MACSPEVTVIIPVYNAARYLAQCIKSVCSQDFQDMEILCIDDASTDGSLDLLHELQKGDARIRIVRNARNLGAGPTRNRGIGLARGRYFLFLDADDLITGSLVSALYQKAERDSLELCFFQHAAYDEERKRAAYTVPTSGLFLHQYRSRVFSWEEVQGFFYQSVFCVPWNRLYLTEFVRDSDVRFPALENSEDLFFGNALVTQAERMGVLYSSGPCLYYRVNSGGQVSDTVSRSPEGALEALRLLYRFLSESGKLEGAARSYHGCALSMLQFVITVSPDPEKTLADINRKELVRIGMSGLGEQDFLNPEAWYLYQGYCLGNPSAGDVYLQMLKKDRGRRQQLEELLSRKGERKTAVWGLGGKSLCMIRQFKEWGMPVDYVIDRKGPRKAGDWDGCRICLPQEVRRVDDIFLTISSILPEVVQECRQRKLCCRIIDLDMFYTLDRKLEECMVRIQEGEE